jgi:hypothetical protein
LVKSSKLLSKCEVLDGGGSAAENECSDKDQHRFLNAHFAPSFTVETEHSRSAMAAWQMTQVLDSKRRRDYL